MKSNSSQGVIVQNTYQYWWQYVYSFSLLSVFVTSIATQWKNKYVQMLLCVFAIDIALHGLISYGIDESFIYGGHWIFMMPLLFGWLYKSIQNKTTYQIYTIGLSVLFVILLVNNAYHMCDFIKYAQAFFPLEVA